MGKREDTMTLRGKNIFILGTSRFDGLDQSTSFNIAKQLSKDNFVYYVDYPITWKDYFLLKDTSQIQVRKSHFSLFSTGIITNAHDNLKIVICPRVLSINFIPEGKIYRSLLKINEMLIRRRIKKVIKDNQIDEFIYINSFNFHYPGIADRLNPSLTVYHCVDPMIIPYDMKHGILSENELVRKSDLVICTSRMLFEEKIQFNPNCHFIPNATDITHSSKALHDDIPVNKLLQNIKKPIVGYVGSIERRFDYKLLLEVISMNKDKSFVFVGPTSTDFVPEWFHKTDNVFHLGRLPYAEMPSLIKGFDVTIIPFKKDEVSRTIFPLKLFEYLASGKPVIATNFNNDLDEFTHGVVTFCEDAESFSVAIENGINEQDTHKKQLRIAVAQENTWENRGEQISELLAENLTRVQNQKSVLLNGTL